GASLGLGLAVVMWNYSGWDTPSTCLGETRAPEHAFRRALFLALPVIAVAYVLPVGALLATGATDWSKWDTGALPRLAGEAGSAWLGHAVALGAVVSATGLFLTLLLTNSRLPYVLARDGLMPARLAAIHPRFGTPWVAVVLSAVLYAAFAVFSFKELIVLNVWLYSLSLLVELGAFVWLRLHASEMARPWRVPGGARTAAPVAAGSRGRVPPAVGAPRARHQPRRRLRGSRGWRRRPAAGCTRWRAWSPRGPGRWPSAGRGRWRVQSLLDDLSQAGEGAERVDIGLPAHRDTVGPLARAHGRIDG